MPTSGTLTFNPGETVKTFTMPILDVDGTAKAGVDYLPTSGTLTFQPGQTVETFTVPILINPLIQSNETVILNLSIPDRWRDPGLPLDGGPGHRRRHGGPDGPARHLGQGRLRPLRGRRRRPHLRRAARPDPAVNLLNYGYSVRTAGRDGKLGTADDQLIGLCPATYNPATRTVTLPLARRSAKARGSRS